MLPFSRYRPYLILVVVLILGTLWIYSNWYFNLNRIFPFSNLTNKVAVDGINIADFSKSADLDEIYLIDTTTNSIRQLTNDNYRDEHPNISYSNDRIYFVSNRFMNEDKPYGNNRSSIYYYDLDEQTIIPAYPTLSNLVSDSSSNIVDLNVQGDLISFIEYYNGTHKLKFGRIEKNELIAEFPVNEVSVIMQMNNTQITIKELGELRTVKINEANMR